MPAGRPIGTKRQKEEMRTIAVRIPISMWKKANKAAEGEGRKMSGYVRRVLQRSLESKTSEKEE
jgi:hypothetical protein